MADHDNSYKLLFSHPEMVRDLLLGFVHEAWVRHLDFSTLEKFSGGYVSDKRSSRACGGRSRSGSLRSSSLGGYRGRRFPSCSSFRRCIPCQPKTSFHGPSSGSGKGLRKECAKDERRKLSRR
ncbi:MAG TPA: hypothetical protein VLE27_03645 [Thermoanaerobaculia bacterium]|nr:hypothetical protein [Thermoanaerobaculia bacterium]